MVHKSPAVLYLAQENTIILKYSLINITFIHIFPKLYI